MFPVGSAINGSSSWKIVLVVPGLYSVKGLLQVIAALVSSCIYVFFCTVCVGVWVRGG